MTDVGLMMALQDVRLAALVPLVLTTACTDAGSVEVGDAMPKLAWEGYVNLEGEVLSSSLPFGDYGTEALEASGRRYALLHTAASF